MKGGNHRVFYLGAQNQVYSWTKLDTQAAWLAHHLSGLIALPSTEDMVADIDKWTEREASAQGVNDIIALQSDYMLELAADSGHLGEDYKRLDAREMLSRWIEHKCGEGEGKGIHQFRKGVFQSRITGEMAANEEGI